MVALSQSLFVDPQSNFLYVDADATYVEGVVLVANTSKAVAVPKDGNNQYASRCLFAGFNNIDFYVRYNKTAAAGAAAIPTNTTDGTAFEANPVGRAWAKGVIKELALIAASNCVGTIIFFW